MNYKPFGDSRLDIHDITAGQVHCACMALERIAKRLLEQEQVGAAEVLTRVLRALLEQNQARIEDARRPGKEGACSQKN
jgi:hypothetical protein